jgi:hypothetical protein
MELRFVASESAFDYFASTRAYLARHGRPAAKRGLDTGRAWGSYGKPVLATGTPQRP